MISLDHRQYQFHLQWEFVWKQNYKMSAIPSNIKWTQVHWTMTPKLLTLIHEDTHLKKREQKEKVATKQGNLIK